MFGGSYSVAFRANVNLKCQPGVVPDAPQLKRAGPAAPRPESAGVDPKCQVGSILRTLTRGGR